MDFTTIQFVVNTLSARFAFNSEDAIRIVEEAAAMSVPAYQKAVKLAEATQSKLDELNAKVRDGKVRKGVDAPAKIAELEKKLEEQKAKVTEAMARGIKKGRAPKPADEAAAEPAEPKAEKPKKEKAPAQEKRIRRMSQTFIKQLENAFDAARMEMKKENSQEFAKYANELTQDDFDAKSLSDHMRDYVASIARQGAPAEMPADHNVQTLRYEELVTTKMTLVEAYGPGIYWNTVTKNFVTGPSADDEEEVTEAQMNDTTYAVGDSSKRVYVSLDGSDEFAGFLGIGKFATLVVAQ